MNLLTFTILLSYDTFSETQTRAKPAVVVVGGGPVGRPIGPGHKPSRASLPRGHCVERFYFRAGPMGRSHANCFFSFLDAQKKKMNETRTEPGWNIGLYGGLIQNNAKTGSAWA